MPGASVGVVVELKRLKRPPPTDSAAKRVAPLNGWAARVSTVLPRWMTYAPSICTSLPVVVAPVPLRGAVPFVGLGSYTAGSVFWAWVPRKWEVCGIPVAGTQIEDSL